MTQTGANAKLQINFVAHVATRETVIVKIVTDLPCFYLNVNVR